MYRPIKQLFTCLLIVSGVGLYIPTFAETACGNSPQAVQLVELIRQHDLQSRADIRCSSKLTQIAEHKANLLSENNVIMHNIGHLTPNQLLRKNGYPLGSGYPVLGNQVEALAAGEKSAKETFQQLINSESHRRLLLGHESFYALQNEIGVAYVRQSKSPFDYYWVIYLADTINRPKPDIEYIVNFDYLHRESEKPPSIRDRHKHSRSSRPQMATDN